MVGMLNDAKSVTIDVIIKGKQGIVKAVYVTKSGAAGSLLNLRDGVLVTDPIVITIEGEAVQNLPFINKTFPNGIFADVVVGGSYLVVFE